MITKKDLKKYIQNGMVTKVKEKVPCDGKGKYVCDYRATVNHAGMNLCYKCFESKIN